MCMLSDSGITDLQNLGKGVLLHVVSLDAVVKEVNRLSMINIESKAMEQNLRSMVRALVQIVS